MTRDYVNNVYTLTREAGFIATVTAIRPAGLLATTAVPTPHSTPTPAHARCSGTVGMRFTRQSLISGLCASLRASPCIHRHRQERMHARTLTVTFTDAHVRVFMN